MPDTGSHSVDKEENKSLISDEAPIHAYKRLLAYDHDWDYTYFIVTLCQQKALYHICKFFSIFLDEQSNIVIRRNSLSLRFYCFAKDAVSWSNIALITVQNALLRGQLSTALTFLSPFITTRNNNVQKQRAGTYAENVGADSRS